MPSSLKTGDREFAYDRKDQKASSQAEAAQLMRFADRSKPAKGDGYDGKERKAKVDPVYSNVMHRVVVRIEVAQLIGVVVYPHADCGEIDGH